MFNWLNIYCILNYPFLFAVFVNNYIIISLLLIVSLLFYAAIHKKLNLSNQYSQFESKEEQFRIYFLFFGITIPLIETIVTFFEIRAHSYMLVNYSASVFLLTVYFLSGRSTFVRHKIDEIFTLFYIAYYGFIGYNVFFRPFELISCVSLKLGQSRSHFVE